MYDILSEERVLLVLGIVERQTIAGKIKNG